VAEPACETLYFVEGWKDVQGGQHDGDLERVAETRLENVGFVI